MQEYSTQAEINDFIQHLANGALPGKLGNPPSKPLFVNDMDGNILMGYNLVAGKEIPAEYPQAAWAEGAPREGIKNPSIQNIPYDADIPSLVEAGIIEPAIFAGRRMDVRLPEHLVDALNILTAQQRPFEVALLTSRGLEDAETILKASGVREPSQLTFVADSGATMYIHGKHHTVRNMSMEERTFVDRISDLKPLETIVDNILNEKGFNPADRPPLLLEKKEIATNIHYRDILMHYQQAEGGELDHAIGERITTELKHSIKSSPCTESGELAFKLLDAPATVEVKLADIHKGHGLNAIVAAAEAQGVKPSAIIFTGDDIAKTSGEATNPGTDYFAFSEGAKIAERTGIPFYGVHTLHPEDGTLTGQVPSPAKMSLPMTDKEHYPEAAQVDITTRTPQQTGDLVRDTMQAVEQRLGAQRINAGSTEKTVTR